MKLFHPHPRSPSTARVPQDAARPARAHSSFVIRHSSFPRAFSLIEVLLAVFILGIGMIMVASVFPVGAKWTQQTTEESMSTVVAQTALTVLDRHYGPGGDLRSYLAPDFYLVGDPMHPPPYPGNANPANGNTILKATSTPVTPFTLQALPGFNQISINERAYQFASSKGSSFLTQPNTFPVADPSTCVYFWTALARLNPAHQVAPAYAGMGTDINHIIPTSSYKYDVYILVFRKGWVDQSFSLTSSEVPNTRSQPFQPSVVYTPYNAGTYTGGTPAIANAVPQIGEYGIGAVSGTIFRQTAAGTPLAGTPRPFLLGQPAFALPQEPIIYCPPADNTFLSPLVYVYQTTLSY